MRGSTRWKAITNQTLASGTPGKIEEEQRRRGEERKSMWKGKEEDSEGTQADVQAAIPADSILLFFFFLLSPLLVFPLLLKPLLSASSSNPLFLCLLWSWCPRREETKQERGREREREAAKSKTRNKADASYRCSHCGTFTLLNCCLCEGIYLKFPKWSLP